MVESGRSAALASGLFTDRFYEIGVAGDFAMEVTRVEFAAPYGFINLT